MLSLLDVVREFVAISGGSRWGGDSIPRARELMVELRRRGFSSVEISELSRLRWSSSVVRTYTREWDLGVVDVSEKSVLISVLRELAHSKYSIGDVDNFNKAVKSMGLKGSTFEEVAELNDNMGSIGLKPGEVGEMLAVSREISGEPGGVRGVRERIALDKKLRDRGITQEVQLDLQEKCKRYGGLGGVLKGLEGYMKLEDLRRETEETRMLLSDKKGELEDVEEKYNKSREANEALAQIYTLDWTPTSLMAFPAWLRRSDTFDGVREALRGTRSIMDLKEAEETG